MCATTKYVSVTCQSNGNAARKITERPPIVKTATAPSANSIAVSRITLPSQVVAIQLKILIPVGTAIAIDESMKNFFFQAEDGIRDYKVTGVQTCALPI